MREKKNYTITFVEPLAGTGSWEEYHFSVEDGTGEPLDYVVRISGFFLAKLSVQMEEVPESEAICASAVEADLLGLAPLEFNGLLGYTKGLIDIDHHWYPGSPGELKFRTDYELFTVERT